MTKPLGSLPMKSRAALEAVQRALSTPMTRQMQLESIAGECKVTMARAETYLTHGRRLLETRRASAVEERAEQMERLRRAAATALVGGKLAAYAAIENLYADIAGTKTPRALTVQPGSGDENDPGPSEFRVRIVRAPEERLLLAEHNGESHANGNGKVPS